MDKYYKNVPVEVWQYTFDEKGYCSMPRWVLRLFDTRDLEYVGYGQDDALCYIGDNVSEGDYLVLDGDKVNHYTPDEFKDNFHTRKPIERS